MLKPKHACQGFAPDICGVEVDLAPTTQAGDPKPTEYYSRLFNADLNYLETFKTLFNAFS